MNRLRTFILRYLYALTASVYVFAVGFMTVRGRNFLLTVCSFFGRTFLPPLLVPPMSESELSLGDTPVATPALAGSDGSVTPFELVTILKIARAHSARTVFEIGTFNGRTALNLAANLPADGRVHTLDLPRAAAGSTVYPVTREDRGFIEKEASGSLFRDTPYASRITQLYGDSAAFDYTPYLGKMDLVFIDGGHARDIVLKDTESAFRLLRGGKGIILWHDYGGWEGVIEALNHLYRTHPACVNMRHIAGTSLVFLHSA